jgi:hypothetical protein
MSDSWISAETEEKEHDFAGIMAMHMQICKSILAKYGGPTYLYADLYAGPGHLEFGDRRFLGSPLIVDETARRLNLAYEALLFEKDAETAARLAHAVAGSPSAIVHSGRCEDGFGRWLDGLGRQSRRYGLVYSDPIRDEIPHQLLSRAATLLPKVDLLSYVSATQYKRRRGVDPSRPLLADHVAAIPKKVVLIREPVGAWQWTFILWSNWVNLPEWKRRGFHRLDTEHGARIMDRLTLTSRELQAATNVPLPLPLETGPAYSTYAEYLRHPRFLKVRTEVFARAAGRCERCQLHPPKDPHHLRYPPWGEFDVPENLIAICHQCHCDIHGKAS